MDWEVRVTLRYGSRHVEYCETKADAVARAEKLMGPEGTYNVVDNVVYYNDHPEDDL